MNLDKVKSDIDDLLEKHRDNWITFVFSGEPEVCQAFKDKQVYQAMLIMAYINTKCHTVKDPEVATHQEGYDLRFTWSYSNQYYLRLSLIIPWEGKLHYEINTFDEESPDSPDCYGDWQYVDFTRVDSSEVADFVEHIKSATERAYYADRTTKTID